MKTYTLEEARVTLSELAKQAYEDEPVVLVDGSRLLILRSYDPPATPWVPPPGYFGDIYSPEEVEWENKLAVDSAEEPEPSGEAP